MTPAGPLRVAVGLSGGVDSAVAAALLLRQGARVVGVTMCLWDGTVPLPDRGGSGCFGPGEARDLESAARVARRLGIEHLRVPLAAEYRREVLDYVRSEYLAGRTPNPCVRCNRALKFGLLADRVREMGVAFDRFATGHYARVERDASGAVRLRRAADAGKDQTYFLSGLRRRQLENLAFPLGELTKREVREEARGLGWEDLADGPESQDFLESGGPGALFHPGESRPGPIRTLDGRLLGEHPGIVHYTVGQRKGLGLGGAGEPYYVVRISARDNTLFVGRRHEGLCPGFEVDEPHWIRPAGAPDGPLRAEVKIRQRHPPAPALLSPRDEGGVRVEFDRPQPAVAPGQAAVFYEGEYVLGSGPIAGPRAEA